MKKLDSEQLRKLYLDFYNSKGHAIIESASLIPENDPTVLFTTAGMHPLVPYLLGEKHPAGNRLTDVQVCVRTGDIESVGDASHCTFFEMLGRWSLGDYFKRESIAWAYELVLNELEFDKDKFAVTVFAGDENCPRDEESAKRWEELGISKDKIFYLDKKHNWWGPAGMTGPCGPDTEMFIDTGKPKCCDECSPACDCGKYMEIGNDVFMQYFKHADGSLTPLKNKNVDEGMGLERMLCILNGYKSVFETDLFSFAIKRLEELSGKVYGEDESATRAMRIIADHTRTATFLLGDRNGVTPSNVDQGYVLRRLIRRAMRFCRAIGVDDGALGDLARLYVEKYKNAYPYIKENEEKIVTELNAERDKFAKTIEQGLKELDNMGIIYAHLPDKVGGEHECAVEHAQEKGVLDRKSVV